MCQSHILVVNKKYGINGQPHKIPVPCGKCPQCIQSKIHSWQFRFEQEMRSTSSPFWFVTFTYNEESVPIDNVLYEKGYPDRNDNKAHVQNVLREKDMRDYLKLLRYHWVKKNIQYKATLPSVRYFYVGEYGTKYSRPHYHMILWNIDDIRLIIDTWPHGFVHIDQMKSLDSIGYCLSYLYDGKGKHLRDIRRFRVCPVA